MNAAAQTEAQTFYVQGTRHLAAGDHTRAETCFRLAAKLAPDFAEAHANHGLLLDKSGNFTAAEICYRRAILLNGELAETHLNLGALLARAKRFNEAEAAYRMAISLAPQSPAGWSNLGVLCACLQRETEAEQCYRSAMQLDASYAMARFNLSYLLLRQGRFEEGWLCFEARNWYAAFSAYFTCPRWQGEALNGQSIVIGAEAGLGDAIQFSRYAAQLKQLGAGSITLVCHPPLKTLLQTLTALDHVIAFDEPLPCSGWDFWTPLMSLPLYCHTRIDTIPATLPYLFASRPIIAKWGAVLPRDGLRVGLVWQGNPVFENDADRSLPSPELLSPLANISGVTFISLQQVNGISEQAHPPAWLQLANQKYPFTDLADTAALIMNLDLVIAVDTAVAHLAGALGKPCWVLLPDYKTDWRWLTHRTDTPWYPANMRLFRQRVPGDWTAVVAELNLALADLVLK